MKRLLVFIWLLTYLVMTTGANLHLHFCMGELDDWSFYLKSQKKTCGNCGMEKNLEPNGCCSDEVKWVKIEDEQKASNNTYQFFFLKATEHSPSFAPTNHLFFIGSAGIIPQNHAPPVVDAVAVYKLNCVFRI